MNKANNPSWSAEYRVFCQKSNFTYVSIVGVQVMWPLLLWVYLLLNFINPVSEGKDQKEEINKYLFAKKNQNSLSHPHCWDQQK